jgi:hypothetical protein
MAAGRLAGFCRCFGRLLRVRVVARAALSTMRIPFLIKIGEHLLHLVTAQAL